MMDAFHAGGKGSQLFGLVGIDLVKFYEPVLQILQPQLGRLFHD